MDREQEHEVEKILDHKPKLSGRRKQQPIASLVRWTGFEPEHDTWEPEAAMRNCPAVVLNYWKEQKQKG